MAKPYLCDATHDQISNFRVVSKDSLCWQLRKATQKLVYLVRMALTVTNLLTRSTVPATEEMTSSLST